MIEIMEEVHNYVPVRKCEKCDEITNKTVPADQVHTILFGGDQLTRRRVETAIELRKNSSSPVSALKGIQPVCEDWLAKKCLLEVIMCIIMLYLMYMYLGYENFHHHCHTL